MVGPNVADDDCPRCGGTGWMRAPDAEDGGVKRCECHVRARCRRRLRGAKIPPRYRECTLDNFATDSDLSSEALAHKVCKNYVDEYPDVAYGLLFTGPPGVGKTHLGVAVMRELILDHGVRGRFADYRTLLQQIQNSYDPISKTSELEVLRPVLRADVLLLDELGARRPTEWVRETVTHILNERYNSQRITLVTTNFSMETDEDRESLADRIDPRARSRLWEMCRVISLKDADDFREKKKQRPGVRYSPKDR